MDWRLAGAGGWPRTGERKRKIRKIRKIRKRIIQRKYLQENKIFSLIQIIKRENKNHELFMLKNEILETFVKRKKKEN